MHQYWDATCNLSRLATNHLKISVFALARLPLLSFKRVCNALTCTKDYKETVFVVFGFIKERRKAKATLPFSTRRRATMRRRSLGRASFDAVPQAAGDPARPGPAVCMKTTWKIIIKMPSRCHQNAGNGLQKSEFSWGRACPNSSLPRWHTYDVPIYGTYTKPLLTKVWIRP